VRAFAAGLAFLGAALSLGRARANPLDAFGFGARAVGLAGAYTAAADDFSATYYNPAALASAGALRLEIGYQYTHPVMTLDGHDLRVDPVSGLHGGLVLPGVLFTRRVAASIGLFLPDDAVSRLRALPEQQPRFVLYDNRPHRVAITAALALETWDNLFIGGGLTFLANTRGIVDIQGQVGLTSLDQTRLYAEVDVDLAAVRYPSFGVLWAPDEHWRVGITLREEFVLRLDIAVNVHGQVLLDTVDPVEVLIEDGSFELVSGNANLFSPRQLALGVSYRGPCWMVALDVSWVQWSRFPTDAASVDIALDLEPITVEVPSVAEPVEPGFHDIGVVRTGAEWDVLDHPIAGLTLRGGYFYEPTPVPDQPGRTNYVDTDKHGLSLGLTLRLAGMEPVLPKPFYLDLASQVVILPERAYRKADPADLVGEYRASGLYFTASFTGKFLF
jgi:long-chain fatty acid transport protein